MGTFKVKNESKQDGVDLVRRAFSWLDTEHDWTTGSTRDLQRQFFDLLADDVVLEVDAPSGTFAYESAFRGKPAVIEMYRNAPEWISDNRLERSLEYVGGGNRVVVLGSERYAIKKSGVVARNKEFAIIVDLRGGQIAKLRQVGDMSEWIDAYRSENIALAKKAYSVLEGNRDAQRAAGDFQPYIDLLADDVVFRYAAPEGTPVSAELRGKPAVIEFMQEKSPQLVENARLDRALEFFGSGTRVVVLGSESYTVRKSGVSAHNKEFAVVLDFREGRISRVLQIKDLSEFVTAFAAPKDC